MNGTPRFAASAARSLAGGEAREPDHAVVAGMDLEDRARPFRDRGAVVGRARAVRRADLDELRPRRGHDVRDPELAADLDQLAARDQDLLAARQRRKGEQERGGAVVHDERVLGSGHRDQQRFCPGRALAALSRLAVDLQIRVGPSGSGGGTRRCLRQRRPPEVRVQHHTRRVDHRRQPARDLRREPDRVCEEVVVGGRLDPTARPRPAPRRASARPCASRSAGRSGRPPGGPAPTGAGHRPRGACDARRPT